MSDLVDDSGPQTIQPNTWTPLLGTDAELLVDGITEAVQVETETLRSSNGDVTIQFTLSLNGVHLALRAPG
ncbi:hypothetical protein SMC26_14615 [Actinomadura fulvescens]|uniref:Halobacterial output domain-containing protein n=1 Tax=Actinomadura fulvescens TaxID=46160 RepID=A0ABP6CBS2_9ACTN